MSLLNPCYLEHFEIQTGGYDVFDSRKDWRQRVASHQVVNPPFSQLGVLLPEMEKWCTSNSACLFVFAPFYPDEEWWNTVSTLNLPYIKLRGKLSYLYQHRKYIGKSRFFTCLILLGCTALETQYLEVDNDHLGFWRPTNTRFFEGVRFPTLNLLFKRCLSFSERQKLKHQTYQTGKDIEQGLREKLQGFETLLKETNFLKEFSG